MPVDLNKVQDKAPELVSLVKSARVSLEKAGLTAHRARVALALDVSGSMLNEFRSGRVQQLAQRVLALGMNFDDNAAIDVFLFDHGAQAHGEMDMDNFREFSNSAISKVGGGTKYAPVMRMMREQYFPGSAAKGLGKLFGRKATPAPSSDLPVYVMFVTDGRPADPRESEAEIVACARVGMFFQFMAIGAPDSPDFDFLRGLDDMEGRLLDNADFFAVKDPSSIAEADLYSQMMTEYPDWVTQAKAHGLVG